MRTSGSNGWRSTHISFSCGLPVPNLPSVHLNAAWCTSSINIIDNGKNTIIGGGGDTAFMIR